MKLQLLSVGGLYFALGVLICGTLGAQTKTTAPFAPIPSQIASAKKIFLSNAGGQGYVYSVIAYNELYADLQSWGKYQFVDTPAAADLILEVHYNVIQTGSVYMRLVLLDSISHFVLWSIDEWVNTGGRESTNEKNVALTADALVVDLKTVAAPNATANPVLHK